MFRKLLFFCTIILFVFLNSSAYADAFIPTMISANILWFVALPLVVVIEGWFMSRRKWQLPYKNAFFGNLWSMLAALPLGIALSVSGSYISRSNALSAFIPDSARLFLAQAFFYGNVPTPSYGYIDDGAGYAGTILAALLFIGICWLLTIWIEGYYYKKQNPSLSTSEIYRSTAFVHVISYCILLFLWVPYSYHVAGKNQESLKYECSQYNVWSSGCPVIFAKFPEIGKERVHSCLNHGIGETDCLNGIRTSSFSNTR